MSEIVKKKGKSFGKILAAIALTGLFILNIGFSVDVSFEDGWTPKIELGATTQQVIAQGGSASGNYTKTNPSCYYAAVPGQSRIWCCLSTKCTAGGSAACSTTACGSGSST